MLRLLKGHPGEVAARMGEASDIAFCQRVEIDRPENHRGGADGRRRNCGLQCGVVAAGDEDIDAAASKLARRRRQTIQISILDEIDRQVAAFDIAQLAKPMLKHDVLG